MEARTGASKKAGIVHNKDSIDRQIAEYMGASQNEQSDRNVSIPGRPPTGIYGSPRLYGQTIGITHPESPSSESDETERALEREA